MKFIELLAELADLPDFRTDRFNPAEPRDESGKWTEGAGSAGKTSWGTVDWHGVKEIEVAKHPDIDDIDKLGEEDKRSTSERGGGWAPTVRLLKNDKGEVFAWPADKAIHDQVAEGIGFELTPSNSAKSTRIVWKKGRKWVSTQSMDGWLREGTIKQIGPNEGSAPSPFNDPGERIRASTPQHFNMIKDLGFDFLDVDGQSRLYKQPRTGLALRLNDDGSWQLFDERGPETKTIAEHKDFDSLLVRLANDVEEPEAVRKKADEHFKSIAAMRQFRFFKAKEQVKGYADAVAKTHNFDSANIGYDSQPKWFTLNGKQFRYGGACNTATGKVTLWPEVLGQDKTQVESLVAHEIEHAKFAFFLNRASAERKQVMDLPHPADRRQDPVKPDGTLRPPYDKQFPFYTAYEKTIGAQFEALAREDGVTDYSREWWKAFTENTANGEQAMHETMAEMAFNEHLLAGEKRLLGPADEEGNFTKSATGGSKRWQDLFSLVNRMWDEHHETGKEKAT